MLRGLKASWPPQWPGHADTSCPTLRADLRSEHSHAETPPHFVGLGREPSVRRKALVRAGKTL
jgi:hypothetical protein